MARRPARGPAAVLVLLGVLGTSACAPGGAEECASWPELSSEQQRTDASQLVVIGTVDERDGDERMLGVDAAAWTVTVDETLKGDAEAGSRIRVVSTPETCGSGDWSDPLDTDTPLVLYLVGDDQGNWATVTPFDGTAPAV
ncbi:hypothetical protein [Mycetocola reblochoni]|uniref:Lipoprotein n=2 Tax=Mycetocola reblochoni TaxID=331618 RepID=A0A1R4JNH8_9MICO|nr:hypothetical protein [Mycetocola reblochoni]RLP68593.1 hypothetical protein D9V30_09990 [Mycetocola reblochoni]SJN33343.1 hypothetical protein FM119_08370 [Mycetocola reblochoni REB411]